MKHIINTKHKWSIQTVKSTRRRDLNVKVLSIINYHAQNATANTKVDFQKYTLINKVQWSTN